ncbi:ATP-binding protein [Parasulfitobacter algicola]|uniref:ATP-binding protein n=1 Tax=Parasulfitobacter algicola TaxID=2614809 RepID=A0ABX2ILE9_9RHOB|nr:ATP-binding protein [Sulfitobacter algicola]NSX53385.1 ATP-binding protein [Sulfitobacter algicola]
MQTERLHFPGETMAVRHALENLKAKVIPYLDSAEETSTVEIVLAEVLNNIVEHAYAVEEGWIELQFGKVSNGIEFDIYDEGVPMPDGKPPIPELSSLDVATDDLPEGGFGWFMIHDLTKELTYRRENNKNHLSFRLFVGKHLFAN